MVLSWVGCLESSMTHRPSPRRFTGTPPTRALRLGDAPYPSLLADCGRDLEALPRRMVRLATDPIVYQVRRARLTPLGSARLRRIKIRRIADGKPKYAEA